MAEGLIALEEGLAAAGEVAIEVGAVAAVVVAPFAVEAIINYYWLPGPVSGYSGINGGGDISSYFPKPSIPASNIQHQGFGGSIPGKLFSSKKFAQDGERTAQDIISKERKGSINKEFPDQYRNSTLDQIQQAADSGDAAAKSNEIIKRWQI